MPQQELLWSDPVQTRHAREADTGCCLTNLKTNITSRSETYSNLRQWKPIVEDRVSEGNHANPNDVLYRDHVTSDVEACRGCKSCSKFNAKSRTGDVRLFPEPLVEVDDVASMALPQHSGCAPGPMGAGRTRVHTK